MYDVGVVACDIMMVSIWIKNVFGLPYYTTIRCIF